MDHYTCTDLALEIYAILPHTRPLNHNFRAISYLETWYDAWYGYTCKAD